ncbi:MAG: hypothetical protein EOT05_00940 [Candidatus Microsaccharimonas sossegonensis]|uniref:DUF4367 domain-containing protein n=1 Tax=Candidatus Microsaccharimonas sossegonensis TaxID=2506948 RepID=A0A4Q0AH53_9BACT|nr:MAG: hypothetical protein EOT05_00940 [Candidatus Microsaccharimonas sossegonensis]
MKSMSIVAFISTHFKERLPLLTALRHRYNTLPKNKKRLVAALVILLGVGLIAVLVTIGVNQRLSTAPFKNDPSITKKYTGKQITSPDYKTLLPVGKTIDSLGGWTRVSPPESNPVFAYIDRVNGKQINVSEQPLPNEFKQDTAAQIQQLASGYKATEKVTVGDVTVFIGTSAKGPQSVIFVKNNLLVLIKSSVALSENDWASYVNSLK